MVPNWLKCVIFWLVYVVDQYSQQAPLAPPAMFEQYGGGRGGAISIGEALEATAKIARVEDRGLEWCYCYSGSEVKATG